MTCNAPDVPALFARLNKNMENAEKQLRTLQQVYPFYTSRFGCLRLRLTLLQNMLKDLQQDYQHLLSDKRRSAG